MPYFTSFGYSECLILHVLGYSERLILHVLLKVSVLQGNI